MFDSFRRNIALKETAGQAACSSPTARGLSLGKPYAPHVLLAYVDESYTKDWFAMTALLVDGPAAAALTDELDRVATTAAKAYGLGDELEIHGYEIFQGDERTPSYCSICSNGSTSA
jgi:hypothetical protein